MNTRNIPLFDWLLENLPKAKFDFANSSITGVSWSELIEMTGFVIPTDLNLNKNDPFGAVELREVLARIYNCDPSLIIPSTGGSEANFIAFLGLVEPGCEVIVEQPSYSPLWQVPEMLGAKIVKWHRHFEDEFCLDLEKLKEKINSKTRLIVLTNLHNPSGVLATHNDIRAVSELALEHSVMVLIDEIFLDVSNSPTKSAVGLDNVIVSSSVSKVFGIGGFRTGWLVAPDEQTAKTCLRAKWQGSVASPYFSELLIASALGKSRENLINRCKEVATRNFPIISQWMERNSDIISWVPPDGGLICFPKFHPGSKLSSIELGRILMAEHGVLISPGEYFGLEGHFRLSFMNNKEDLINGLNAISDVIRN